MPEYPAAAQRDRVTGSVVLQLDLDAEGRVVDARIERGLRQDVDDAALVAARALRFAPLPAPATIRYAFTFTLAVADEQGNPVAASATIRVVDDAGLEVPGATATASVPLELTLADFAGGPLRVEVDSPSYDDCNPADDVLLVESPCP